MRLDAENTLNANGIWLTMRSGKRSGKHDTGKTWWTVMW